MKAWKPEAQDGEGCWIWRGAKNAGGYGTRWVGKVKILVHRASYEAYVGPIPDGLTVDHLCRVRARYNPAHLEAVTLAENTRRAPHIAAKIAQTQCLRGHELDGVSSKGRHCKTCARDAARAWRLANPARANEHSRAYRARKKAAVA